MSPVHSKTPCYACTDAHCEISAWELKAYRSDRWVLPGLVKVFSGVSHSTGNSQPLTQRSSGHVHKLLFLFVCKKNMHSVRQRRATSKHETLFVFFNNSKINAAKIVEVNHFDTHWTPVRASWLPPPFSCSDLHCLTGTGCPSRMESTLRRLRSSFSFR